MKNLIVLLFLLFGCYDINKPTELSTKACMVGYAASLIDNNVTKEDVKKMQFMIQERCVNLLTTLKWGK